MSVIESLVAERGAPQHLRMDNGPELIAWALRDWCRLAGTAAAYIEPGSPWENPFVESFNGRVRDELLNVEEFGSLLEAEIVVEGWRTEYNTYRPHSSLGGLTPIEYRAKWDAEQPSPAPLTHPRRFRSLYGLPRGCFPTWTTPTAGGPLNGVPSMAQAVVGRVYENPEHTMWLSPGPPTEVLRRHGFNVTRPGMGKFRVLALPPARSEDRATHRALDGGEPFAAPLAGSRSRRVFLVAARATT